MAGSYRTIVNSENEFIGIKFIENLGDAWEALEECYLIIRELGGDKRRIYEADVAIHKRAFPDEEFPFTFEEYWE